VEHRQIALEGGVEWFRRMREARGARQKTMQGELRRAQSAKRDARVEMDLRAARAIRAGIAVRMLPEQPERAEASSDAAHGERVIAVRSAGCAGGYSPAPERRAHGKLAGACCGIAKAASWPRWRRQSTAARPTAPANSSSGCPNVGNHGLLQRLIPQTGQRPRPVWRREHRRDELLRI